MNFLFILFFITMIALTLSSIIVLFMSVRVKRPNSRRALNIQLFKVSGYITILTAAGALLYLFLYLETTIFGQAEVWYGVLYLILVFFTGGIFFSVRLMFNLRGVNLFFIPREENEKR